MSKEVRIGILALVSTGLALWGIKFIQGQNILSRSTTYYAYYDDVSGIQIGTPVQISGVTVGSVSSKDLSVEDRRVRLTLDLEREVPLPKTAVAVLATTSALGDKAIILRYNLPCTVEGECAESGDTLEGRTQGMIESMLGEGGLDSAVNTLKDGIQEILDTLNHQLLGEDSNSPVAETARDLRSTMENLRQATDRANLLLQRSSPQLEGSLASVNELLETLSAQRESIARILSNTDSLSQQIVDAHLDETIEQVNKTISELNTTLGLTNTAMEGVSGVVNGIQEGNGTLGKLVNDEELYYRLLTLSAQLDSLFGDIQTRPYRYIPLKGRNQINRYDRKDSREEANNE